MRHVGKEELARDVEALKGDRRVRGEVRNRIMEFEGIGRSGKLAWFKELCFCLLTANFSAFRSFSITNVLDRSGLLREANEQKLSYELMRMGHRFPRARARYIVAARTRLDEIYRTIPPLGDHDARRWLVDAVKGLGMKESSHFLRNIGRKDLAIIDRHVARVAVRYDLTPEVPKSMTKRRYLAFERALGPVAELTSLSLAELDLYLWYTAKGVVFR